MTIRGERVKILVSHPQRGTALVMAILILLVLTIIGIYAISTSTVEMKISGLGRELKEAFTTADSGAPIGIEVTKLIIHENPQAISDLPSPWKDVVKDSNLLSEIFTITRDSDQPTDSNPDIDSTGDSNNLDLPSSVRLRMDIDRLQAYPIAGSGIEFAAGYRGIGEGGGGGVGIIFAMDSLGELTLGKAKSEVETGYLHVVGMPGGE